MIEFLRAIKHLVKEHFLIKEGGEVAAPEDKLFTEWKKYIDENIDTFELRNETSGINWEAIGTTIIENPLFKISCEGSLFAIYPRYSYTLNDERLTDERGGKLFHYLNDKFCENKRKKDAITQETTKKLIEEKTEILLSNLLEKTKTDKAKNEKNLTQ